MTTTSPDLQSLGCPYHMTFSQDCLYCRQHSEYEATRTVWQDKCPHCDSAEIARNSLLKQSWCRRCGRKESPNA